MEIPCTTMQSTYHLAALNELVRASADGIYTNAVLTVRKHDIDLYLPVITPVHLELLGAHPLVDMGHATHSVLDILSLRVHDALGRVCAMSSGYAFHYKCSSGRWRGAGVSVEHPE
jgi:hypothetical protein